MHAQITARHKPPNDPQPESSESVRTGRDRLVDDLAFLVVQQHRRRQCTAPDAPAESETDTGSL